MLSVCLEGYCTKIMGEYVGYKDCNQLERSRKTETQEEDALSVKV